MKTRCYSHNSGDRVVPQDVAAQVEQSLKECNGLIRPNGARQLRTAILERLRMVGWSNPVRLRAQRGLTITAMHDRLGMCLQTGNMARFYADLIKLQAQFVDGKISSAVYILPLREAAVRLGSNIANFERFTAELEIFRGVITVPILVVGFKEE